MEKELKALENLKTAPSFMGGTEKYRFSTNSQAALLEDYELVKQALTTKSKKEQAFDIIKGKDVDIYIFTSCKTLNEYNSSVVYIVGEPRELTQEEYDLLNEVLLNE